MSKKKYYVVWQGRNTGVFSSWTECKEQVHGFPNAKYKSYPTKEAALEAWRIGPEERKIINKDQGNGISYIEKSISVDAACSGNPGLMEYQGVHTKTGEPLFHYGPVENGTNNLGEFLAIVHALALAKERNCSLPIYSDSSVALGWVQKKRVGSKLPREEGTIEVWNLVDRAVRWLENNHYENKLLKWDTDRWGEIKADFGRK